MRRLALAAAAAAAVALTLASLALPAAEAGGGAASLDLLFHPPAQMGPTLGASRATWALLVFGEGDGGRIDAAFPAGARQSIATVHRARQGSMDWSPDVAGPDPAPRDLPPLAAHAEVGGVGSLYVEGDALTLEASGAMAEAVPGECAKLLLTADERAGREARYDVACPGPGQVALAARGGPALRVRATGVRVLEWHHVAVQCAGGEDACPTGGARRSDAVGPPGAGAEAQELSYERLTPAGAGSATLEAGLTATRILLGGPALDLDVDGQVRLPLARGSPACACPALDGRTFQSDGAVRLAGLRAAGDGLLRASVSGSPGSARLDEQGIDPAALGLGAAAGAALAGLALAAAKAVPALFTRLTPEGALTNALRRELLEAVRANPGIHERALARLAGRSPGTVRHHVAMLAAQGLVERRRHGRRRLLFDRRPGAPRGAPAALLEPGLRRLDDWRQAHPGASASDAVRHAVQAWGWSRSTAYHRLARLDASLLVRS